MYTGSRDSSPFTGCATRLLEHGYDIRTVQELLGHKNFNTTMVYMHVMLKGAHAVKSPLDMV
jgi:site-specific recombinase XerD